MLRWPSSRTAFSAFCTLLALAVLCSGVVVAGGTSQFQTTQQSPGDGQMAFLVDIGSEGDAEWQITERIPVREGEESAFQAQAAAFETGERDRLGVGTLQTVAELLDAELDRSMSTTTPQRTATLEDGEGVFSVSLTWENFSRVTDGELRVDDVLTVGGETWFDGLEEDQTLSVVPPDGFGVEDANAPIQAGRLTWEGPATFDEDTLEMVFTGENGDPGGPNDPGTEDDSNDGNGGNGTDQSNLLWLLGGALIVAVLAALVFLYREQADSTAPAETDEAAESSASAPDTDGADEATPAGASASPEGAGDGSADTAGRAEKGSADASGTAEEGLTDTTGTAKAEAEEGSTDTTGTVKAEAEEGSTDTDGTAAAESDESGDTGDERLDETLLSDEERVERLLESNGGRMKQAAIVEETDWSNAKVSQLLSSMDEEDRIDKLRIGRENLISFPDVDITGSNDEE
jgi:uncharacterized membrane protein